MGSGFEVLRRLIFRESVYARSYLFKAGIPRPLDSGISGLAKTWRFWPLYDRFGPKLVKIWLAGQAVLIRILAKLLISVGASSFVRISESQETADCSWHREILDLALLNQPNVNTGGLRSPTLNDFLRKVLLHLREIGQGSGFFGFLLGFFRSRKNRQTRRS